MRLLFLAVSVCTLACACLSLPFAASVPAATIVVSAADPAAATPETLEAARAVLQARYDESLNGRAAVRVSGDALHIELFDGDDTALASQLATEVGALEFFDSDSALPQGASAPAGLEPVLTEADIESAQAALNEQTGGYFVLLTLTDEGRGKLAGYTQASVGRYLVVTRDGIVLSSPIIMSPITEGQAVVEGGFDQAAANALAAQLNSGRLPLALVVSEVK